MTKQEAYVQGFYKAAATYGYTPEELTKIAAPIDFLRWVSTPGGKAFSQALSRVSSVNASEKARKITEAIRAAKVDSSKLLFGKYTPSPVRKPKTKAKVKTTGNKKHQDMDTTYRERRAPHSPLSPYGFFTWRLG